MTQELGIAEQVLAALGQKLRRRGYYVGPVKPGAGAYLDPPMWWCMQPCKEHRHYTCKDGEIAIYLDPNYDIDKPSVRLILAKPTCIKEFLSHFPPVKRPGRQLKELIKAIRETFQEIDFVIKPNPELWRGFLGFLRWSTHSIGIVFCDDHLHAAWVNLVPDGSAGCVAIFTNPRLHAMISRYDKRPPAKRYEQNFPLDGDPITSLKTWADSLNTSEVHHGPNA